MGIPASYSRIHLSHHRLGSIAVMVVTPDRVERRWDDQYWGWPERVKCGNESVMVRLSDQCSADKLLIFTVIPLASISSTRRVHHSSQMHTYAVSPGVEFLISHPDGLVGLPSLSSTPLRPKTHPRVQPSPCMHRSHRNPVTLP